MRAAQFIFLNLSLFLLLAHSFVPHAHELEEDIHSLDVVEKHKPLNVLDWLLAVFQQDLGEEHLENYCPSCKYFATYILPHFNDQAAYTSWSLILLEQELDYLPYRASFHVNYHSPFTENRGPPLYNPSL